MDKNIKQEWKWHQQHESGPTCSEAQKIEAGRACRRTQITFTVILEQTVKKKKNSVGLPW